MKKSAARHPRGLGGVLLKYAGIDPEGFEETDKALLSLDQETTIVDDADAHPENHEDVIAEYREVHGDEDAESEIADLISSTRRGARLVTTSLDEFGRAS